MKKKKAKERINPYYVAVLSLIIIASIASLFDKFQALTFLFVGTRTTMYMLDTIKVLSIANIIMCLFAFKFKKHLFWPLNLSLAVNLLLAMSVLRPHLVVMFGLLLVLFLISYKSEISKLDKIYIWTRISFFLILVFIFLNGFYLQELGFPELAAGVTLMLLSSLATFILSIIHLKRIKNKIFPIFALVCSGAVVGLYLFAGVGMLIYYIF